MRVQEITYYLEMTDPADLRPARPPRAPAELRRAEIPCPEFNRFFYTAIGGDWFWVDRLAWTYNQWMEYLTLPGHETWAARVAGTPAGYFELDGPPGGDVEIAYFGLLPQFAGRGLGGWLLTAAVERAWQTKPRRVWLHTCSLDHPHALANYRARGFRLVKEEAAWKDLPERTPGPWPGADRRTGPAGSQRAEGAR
jgi:ribosomal protein S18 acetylase RimI-like enzyme